MDARDNCLLVFARDPQCGQAKTRLVPVLGQQTAIDIYRKLLADTLDTAAQAAAGRHELWVDCLPARSELTTLAARHGMPIRVQRGADLGARMHAALTAALWQAKYAVLIGTDCPELDAAYLGNAFRGLERHDVVLGPAADGGYVLIGLRRTNPLIFDDIPWGSDRVLAATRRRLGEIAWSWHELPTLHDVDEPADLKRFPELAALAGIRGTCAAHDPQRQQE